MVNIFQLIQRLQPKPNDIVVFDIDDTMFDPTNGNENTIVIQFYQFLIQNNINTAIITAREDTPINRLLTEQELHYHGITNWKYLLMRNPTEFDLFYYKRNMRKLIHDDGYKVIISIGDKEWDIGDYGGFGIIVQNNKISNL
jgi:hypothetical protein